MDKLHYGEIAYYAVPNEESDCDDDSRNSKL